MSSPSDSQQTDTSAELLGSTLQPEEMISSKTETSGENTNSKKPGSSSGASSKADDKRRSHSRSFQTLHGGSKIKHLKKLDGEPLWRVDIQYDFLAYVFHNTQQVFRNSYESSDITSTFADIYIDAMARSSKTSKILCEKLLGDRKAGLNMAMVCLLVNVGRMNTTLNFFPEMRAQLRTYHPIPSLQTYNDQNDYKQLQDAPRLKSILKGACEDRPEPNTFTALEDIQTYPKTNPINLVFLMSTYANKLQEKFFVPPYEFHDLIMNTELSSESRGRVFLWLMWAFLETDLSQEQLEKNPFGKGQENCTQIPEFVTLTPEQIKLENVDPENEIAFGNNMTRERKLYIDSTQQSSPPAGATATSSQTGSLSESKTGEGSRKKSNTANGENSTGFSSRASTPATGDINGSLIISQLDGELGVEDGTGTGFSSPSKGERHSQSSRQVLKIVDPIVYKAAARDQQCQIEIKKMLAIKDRENKRRRYNAGAMYREWVKIRDYEPLYNSDVEDYPKEAIENEKPMSKGTEHKDDLATLMGYKKRKRHIPQQESYIPSSSNISTIDGLGFLEPLETGHPSAVGNDNANTYANFANTVLSLSTTSPATIGKASTKITVNNRIQGSSSFGEESLAMAKAFRRSLRWLKRWRYIQLIKGVKFKEQIENERNERDKKLHEREYQEYGNVEKAFREGRKRAAELFEKEFGSISKEKSERRNTTAKAFYGGENGNQQGTALKDQDPATLKPAKKYKKKATNEEEEGTGKKIKASSKQGSKKPVMNSEAFQKIEMETEKMITGEIPQISTVSQIPVEYSHPASQELDNVSSIPSGGLAMFDSGVITSSETNDQLAYDHAPLGMASPPVQVLMTDPANMYGSSVVGFGNSALPSIDPMNHDLAMVGGGGAGPIAPQLNQRHPVHTSIHPMESVPVLNTLNSADSVMSGFPMIPTATAHYQAQSPERVSEHGRPNVMSLGNLLDNSDTMID